MPSTKRIKEVHKSNVAVRASQVAPNAGNGLFALKRIPKNGLICTYAGKLVDSLDSKYLDPTYMVNFELGKGFKLDGDGEDGDVGHFANSLTPHQSQQQERDFNARIDLKKKYSWVVPGTFHLRGRFDLVAKRMIKRGEEIILDYGKGYWKTMNDWIEIGAPAKSECALARESRYLKRINSDSTTSCSSSTSSSDCRRSKRLFRNRG